MAKGSSTSYGGWEDLTCARCGRLIFKSGPRAVGAMFRYGDPPVTWCGPCIPVSHLQVETEVKTQARVESSG